jgi:drug/metabolite transporter (DMT)-like permease
LQEEPVYMDESCRYTWHPAKACMTFLYVILQIASEGSVFACYYFLYQCEKPINSGIISSIFTMNIVWITIMFYYIYGQRISWTGLFGIFLLFAGVLILGFETGFDNLHVLP